MTSSASTVSRGIELQKRDIIALSPVRDFSWRDTGKPRAPIIDMNLRNATCKWFIRPISELNLIQRLLRICEGSENNLWKTCGSCAKSRKSSRGDMEFCNWTPLPGQKNDTKWRLAGESGIS